jgi:hypothetical protein
MLPAQLRDIKEFVRSYGEGWRVAGGTMIPPTDSNASPTAGGTSDEIVRYLVPREG